MIQQFVAHEASRKVAGVEMVQFQEFLAAVVTALIVLGCFGIFRLLAVYIMNLVYEYFIQKNMFNL
jgi:hypothetical protein